jgi:hypothetical protein
MRQVKKFHLMSMPSAQTHVEFLLNDGEIQAICFFSYSTLELLIHKNESGRWVCKVCAYAAYSTTTARHYNRFTNEFFGNNLYFECKAADIGSNLNVVISQHDVESFYNHYVSSGKRIR